MSDDNENEEKPKRKYTRRFTGVAAIDDEIDEAVSEISEDISDESDLEIIDTSEEEKSASAVKLLFPEPTDDSLKANIGRKLGLYKTVVYKSWAKRDRWICTKCKFNFFDEKRANNHRCS